MTIKTIVEIAVDPEGNFNKFKKLFDEYQASLQKQGGQWKDTDKAVKQTTKDMGSLLDSVTELADQSEKAGKQVVIFRQQSQASERTFRDLAKSTKSIASDIFGATTSLLKWASITGAIGGLIGAGSLFGIDRLAASVMNTQKTAGGFGISPGQLLAARTNFQNLVSPDQMLQNIADAQLDPAGAGWFKQLGIQGWKDKDAAELMPEVIQKIHDIWQRGGNARTSAFMESRGALRFASGMGDIRRIGTESQEDLNKEFFNFSRDSRNLNYGKGTADAWTNLEKQLQRAGAQIETTLVKGLIPLTGPLEKLSAAVARALGTLLTSPGAKTGIEELGKGIEDFAKYLTSPAFKSDMQDVAEGFGKVASGLKYLYDLLPDSPKEKQKKNQQEFLSAAEYVEKQNNLPKGALTALLMANTQGLKNLVNPYHLGKSDIGLFQDASDLSDPFTSAMKMGAKIKEMTRYFGNDPVAGEYAAIYGRENVWNGSGPAGRSRYVPTAEQKAGVKIFVQDTTGGSVQWSVLGSSTTP